MSNNANRKEVDQPRIRAPETAVQRTESLPGRIGASASGLLQTSFGRTSPGSVANSLTSLNADADASKGASASSSNSSGEASSSSQAFSARGGSAASRRALPEESFRSELGRPGISTQNSQVDFDEFVARSQGPGPRFEPIDDDISWSGQLTAHSYIQEEENGSQLTQEEASFQQAVAPSEEQLIRNSDGAAVVALLSDPGFTIETELNDSDAFMPSDKREELLSDKRPNESADLFALTNPLDLMPDFDSSWESVHLAHYFNGETFSDASFSNIQPWADILDRYHDEVWGDMLPLVKEAREEVKAAKASPEGALQDRPAIRRLGMLLKHLDHPMG